MKNILELLEKTAEQIPDDIAVDDGAEIMTYRQLKNTAARIGAMIHMTVPMRKPVAIIAEKSALTLSMMLGSVYAGCFYVVIDPAQPDERLTQILKILQPSLVLTSDMSVTNRCNSIGFRQNLIMIASSDAIPEMTSDLHKNELRIIRNQSSDSDLLYGIFTSGSTGIPKCVTVSHRAVLDFITHFQNTFHFQKTDRFGNQAPFDFDVSVKDIYTSLAVGGTLVLISKELFASPARLLDVLVEKKVTVLIWAVSALCVVSSLKGLQYRIPSDVRMILFSGEVMPLKQLRIWRNALPKTEFVNLYGPSEITCNCTYYRVPMNEEITDALPIGKAFAGRSILLMNGGERIKTDHLIGEICVKGTSLAEGYYHNESETMKHFVTLPNGQRMYRTGDLGFYDRSGNLHFAGRKDFQIKHMGHRIELEEIEQKIDAISGITRSCCLFDQKRNRLNAFYIGELSPAEIRLKLKHLLPGYMIPHKLQPIQELPLTNHGKVDRKVLATGLEREGFH